MKRLIVTALGILLMLLAVVFLIIRRSPDVHAAPTHQVVLLHCERATILTSQDIKVLSSDSSNGAPAIVGNSSCSQSVADLLSQGFNIESATVDPSSAFNYTLVK